MDSLFDDNDNLEKVENHGPLAERQRPGKLSEVVGQSHLIGSDGPLRYLVQAGKLPSMILWGPPGSGKTTLALVLASEVNGVLERMSAVESGVKELREMLARAQRRIGTKRTILFIDEIHRFTKSQQDALLHAVEKGVVTLIGATTENPSFEVNAALLSRCQVYRLTLLDSEDIKTIVQRALAEDEQMRAMAIHIDDWDAVFSYSQGDARTALNAIETAISLTKPDQDGVRNIDAQAIAKAVQRKAVRYDKKGDMHYDVISAFIKSMRGSDPDAALFYLAVMIEAGEDPLFIARRLCIFASEDVGNADPAALGVAVNTFAALERIGMPEGRIVLAQATTYLASASKSNASYVAINQALHIVQTVPAFTIPMHLRNAPTKLMKDFGHGAEYQYPHSHPEHFVNENYFPDEVGERTFYTPDGQGSEKQILARLQNLRPEKYQQDK